eukprot:2744540-Amphidinium_carterae.2
MQIRKIEPCEATDSSCVSLSQQLNHVMHPRRPYAHAVTLPGWLQVSARPRLPVQEIRTRFVYVRPVDLRKAQPGLSNRSF